MRQGLLLALLAALSACTSLQGNLTGKLSVVITGLPQGVEAKVKVGDKTLTSSQVLELPEGTYEVVAERVALATGEVYAPTMEGSPAKVEYGKEARVSVVYALDPNTKPATLAIVISGLPEGAEGSVRVRGTGVDKVVKTTTWLTLPAGTYVIEASPVVYAGERYIPTPQAESVSLAPGSSVSKEVRYSKEVKTGELLVAVSGLPEGVNASVRVLDGSGTTVASLTGSRLLALPAGVYFVEASAVGSYTPTVQGSPAQVQAGSRAEVRVVYEARPASLGLNLSKTALSVPRGGSDTTTATLTPQNWSGTVSFSLVGAPDGVSVSPESVRVQGQTQVLLAVRVGDVAPGTYPITLKASGGGVEATAAFTLTVPKPTFTFDLTPGSLTLTQGGSATLVASITPQNGFQGQVSFSLVGAPAGFALSGGPVQVDGGVDVPLVLSVGNVAPGSYSLVVKAEGGGVSRTRSLTVQVQASTGKLALSIQFQGAPAGSQGYLVVSGPSGDMTVNTSALLTLSPGTYVITAYSVKVDGTPYDPNPPGGTVEVQAGGTATFTVVYSPRQSQ